MKNYKLLPRKILILSRYDTIGASSRVRIFQYLPYIESSVKFKISPFFSNTMITELYNNKKRNLFLLFIAYLRRIKALLTIYKYDIIWVEKEALPFFLVF